MVKIIGEEMYNNRKFGQPCEAYLKKLSRELLVPRKRQRKYFYVQSYKMKAVAEQSSISMLNDVKKIEKIFLGSRTIMAKSSQIQ